MHWSTSSLRHPGPPVSGSVAGQVRGSPVRSAAVRVQPVAALPQPLQRLAGPSPRPPVRVGRLGRGQEGQADLDVDHVVDDAAQTRRGDALVEPLLGTQLPSLVGQQADAEEQHALHRPAEHPVLVPERVDLRRRPVGQRPVGGDQQHEQDRAAAGEQRGGAGRQLLLARPVAPAARPRTRCRSRGARRPRRSCAALQGRRRSSVSRASASTALRVGHLAAREVVGAEREPQPEVDDVRRRGPRPRGAHGPRQLGARPAHSPSSAVASSAVVAPSAVSTARSAAAHASGSPSASSPASCSAQRPHPGHVEAAGVRIVEHPGRVAVGQPDRHELVVRELEQPGQRDQPAPDAVGGRPLALVHQVVLEGGPRVLEDRADLQLHRPVGTRPPSASRSSSRKRTRKCRLW